MYIMIFLFIYIAAFFFFFFFWGGGGGGGGGCRFHSGWAEMFVLSAFVDQNVYRANTEF